MVTFGRLLDGVPAPWEDRIRKCCCALAEAIVTYQAYGTGGAEGSGLKTAETIGAYSVSYATPTESISALLNGETSGLQDYLRASVSGIWAVPGCCTEGCEISQPLPGEPVKFLMYTNKITVFARTVEKDRMEQYVRHFFPAIYWEDMKGQSQSGTSMKQQDSVLCIIPAASVSGYIPKRSDRILCGRCTAAEPPEECRTVMEVKDFRYGSAGVQHLEVTAV